jgi:uncharacterized membrane protein YfcA
LDLLFLGLFAFIAGFVDSIVGGGGLIQLPALFIFLPQQLATSMPTVFGTNKLAAVCGTGTAAVQFARRVTIPWFSVLPAAIAAFIFSAAGARVVQLVNSAFLKPLVLVLLIVVAIYTYFHREFGRLHAPKFVASHERFLAILAGAIIGFYDGFFGPGTGSFLIFIFICFFGFDFLTASASAKVINVATNIAAIGMFASRGHVLYEIALVMGACNILGAIVGTRLAILKGNAFIRWIFLVIVLAMIARFAYEQFAR